MFSLLLSGCFFPQSTVVSRFAGEYACPEKRVQVEKLGNDRYRAQGCNRRANYSCSGDYGELCRRIGQPETINPHPEDAAAPPPSGEPAQVPSGEPAQ